MNALRSRQLWVVSALCVFALALAAQEKSSAGKKAKAASQGLVVKVSPEMQKLNKMLLGAWSHAEKFPPSPMIPSGGSAHGTEVFHPGPGGLYVLAEYASTGTFGSYRGHAVLNWNEQSKNYNAFWIDSFGTNPMTMTGNWNGNDLILNGEYDMQGKKTQIKWIYKNITPNSFTFEEYSTPQGGPANLDIVTQYRRQGAPEKAPAAAKN